MSDARDLALAKVKEIQAKALEIEALILQGHYWNAQDSTKGGLRDKPLVDFVGELDKLLGDLL